jgi:hypothetical protein
MDRLIIAFLLVLTFLRKREHPNNATGKSDGNTNPPNGDQEQAPPDKAVNNGWHPKQNHHRRWEKGYWVASVLLSAVITGGALASAAYAWNALQASRDAVREAHVQAVQATRQADIAQEQMLAAIRPWISPSIEINGLEIKKTGINLHLTIVVKNTGRVPIFTPFTNADIFVGVQNDLRKVGNLLQEKCETATRQRWAAGRSGGAMVPPDGQWLQPRDLPIDDPQQWARINSAAHATIFIYGCAVYGFQGDAAEHPGHRTSFIYEIGMIDPRDDASVIDLDLTQPHTINGSDLRIKQEFLDTRAD